MFSFFSPKINRRKSAKQIADEKYFFEFCFQCIGVLITIICVSGLILILKKLLLLSFEIAIPLCVLLFFEVFEKYKFLTKQQMNVPVCRAIYDDIICECFSIHVVVFMSIGLVVLLCRLYMPNKSALEHLVVVVSLLSMLSFVVWLFFSYIVFNLLARYNSFRKVSHIYQKLIDIVSISIFFKAFIQLCFSKNMIEWSFREGDPSIQLIGISIIFWKFGNIYTKLFGLCICAGLISLFVLLITKTIALYRNIRTFNWKSLFEDYIEIEPKLELELESEISRLNTSYFKTVEEEFQLQKFIKQSFPANNICYFEFVNYKSPEYFKLVKLRSKVLREPLGLEFTEEQLEEEKDDLHLAGFLDGEIVSCLLMRKVSDEQIRFKLVAVSPDHQGKRLGQALMLFAEDESSRLGYKEVVLLARESAIPFYAKLGYEQYGESEVQIGIRHIWMKKSLKLYNEAY